MKQQLKALEALQELDLKIDGLQKNKDGLPVALRALEDVLAKAHRAVDAKTNAIAELEKNQRQTQAAQDMNKERLSRSSTRLESVRNSQEYQAVSKEMEQARKLAITLDEQSKKMVQDIEAAKKDLEGLKEQAAKAQAERDAQAATVSGQSSQVDGEIGVLVSQRGQYVPLVQAQVLSRYDRVRAARGGLGFVPAVGGRCKACNMIVPPQMYNELQKGEVLHSCPSCSRMLFAPAVVASTAAQPATA